MLCHKYILYITIGLGSYHYPKCGPIDRCYKSNWWYKNSSSIVNCILQVDMLGKDIYELIMDKDHAELKKQFMDKFEGTTAHNVALKIFLEFL